MSLWVVRQLYLGAGFPAFFVYENLPIVLRATTPLFQTFSRATSFFSPSSFLHSFSFSLLEQSLPNFSWKVQVERIVSIVGRVVSVPEP